MAIVYEHFWKTLVLMAVAWCLTSALVSDLAVLVRVSRKERTPEGGAARNDCPPGEPRKERTPGSGPRNDCPPENQP